MSEKYMGHNVFAETENYVLSADDTKAILDDYGAVHILHRLIAKKEIAKPGRVIEVGENLGYVESTDNIKQNAVVDKGSMVYGRAYIQGNARVERSVVCCESKNEADAAVVEDNAIVKDSLVNGNSVVSDDAEVYNSKILYHALVYGKAFVKNSEVTGQIRDHASVSDSEVYGIVRDHAIVERAVILEDGVVCGNAHIKPNLINCVVGKENERNK